MLPGALRVAIFDGFRSAKGSKTLLSLLNSTLPDNHYHTALGILLESLAICRVA